MRSRHWLQRPGPGRRSRRRRPARPRRGRGRPGVGGDRGILLGKDQRRRGGGAAAARAGPRGARSNMSSAVVRYPAPRDAFERSASRERGGEMMRAAPARPAISAIARRARAPAARAARARRRGHWPSGTRPRAARPGDAVGKASGERAAAGDALDRRAPFCRRPSREISRKPARVLGAGRALAAEALRGARRGRANRRQGRAR